MAHSELMEKKCIVSGELFEVTDFEQGFLKKIAPTFDGKRFEIPLPSLSPVERTRQRTAHRNEQHLFRNKNYINGKSLVSIYRPDSGRKICAKDEWFSDIWDPTEVGREWNPNKKFFDQFHALQLDVPYASTVVCDNENSEYTTGTGFCKNCHLINSSEHCEDCMYGKLLQRCTNVVDTGFAYDSELLYECFSVEKCYDCKWTYYSQGCHTCWFCDDCRSCSDCFLCTGLVQKKYHFQNQPLSKEEYQKRVADFLANPANVALAKKLFSELRLNRIHKFANVVNCENCTGDFLVNCKNCTDCYDCNGSEDCLHVQLGVEVTDCVDCSNMYIKPELSYQTLGTIGTHNCHFCLYVFHSSDLWYCEQCYNSSNCFGCVGLRNKKYHIFNRPFSPEEYDKKVAEIIRSMQVTGEWGQFFPVEISPFPYNDTVAHAYHPLTDGEAVSRGWRWGTTIDSTSQPATCEVPAKITDVQDSITEEILACADCKKNYRIQPSELKFYKKMHLPVPNDCPSCRHVARMSLRNPFKLYDRKCAKCASGIQSTFSPDRGEQILCESCYQRAVS